MAGLFSRNDAPTPAQPAAPPAAAATPEAGDASLAKRRRRRLAAQRLGRRDNDDNEASYGISERSDPLGGDMRGGFDGGFGDDTARSA